MTAKIKLNAASGGGSISIQAPSSSSNNRVISLPDIADGTLVTSQSTLDATKLSGNLPALNGSALTNLPSGGDYVKLQHNSTGGGSSQYLIFNNLDVATYKYFDFTISLHPETDDKLLRFRFRTGTGTSTSGSDVVNSSDYGWSYYQHWGTDNFGEAARTSQVSITFADTIGNNTNNYEGMALRMRIHFANSNDTQAAGLQNWVDWAFAAKDPDNNINQGRGTGAYHGSGTLYPTGFQIYMNSGAINAHTYTLYGKKR